MNNIPKHIVLFPDGNRRWAKKKGAISFDGHKQGYKNIIEFTLWCKNRGVKIITAFGFSTENWNRSEEEINYLMKLLESGLLESFEKFKKEGIKVKIIGQKEKLPDSLQRVVNIIEKETESNNNLCLNLAISYGGKWDILSAVKKIIKEKIDLSKIDEKLFESLPDKTYDKVSLGALIDKLEEQWPFSEEYKTELKEEYAQALQDIKAGKVKVLSI